MAEPFTFELVSPERLLLSEEVTEVVIPGTEGEMTVMAEHAPVMTTVKPGTVTVKDASGKSDQYVVFGGFADILPSGCTLLAEEAMHVDDVNREAIQERIQTAKDDLEKAESDEDKTSLAQYLEQLSTLEQTVLPA